MSHVRKVAAAVIVLDNENQKKKRKYWGKSWLEEREKYRHINLIKELRENNPDDFKNYLRMSNSVFDILLEKLNKVQI